MARELHIHIRLIQRKDNLMKKALITLVACYLSMIAIIEVAHASDTSQCDMQLRSAIRITADRIEVIDADGVLMQISSEDQLLIAAAT